MSCGIYTRTIGSMVVAKVAGPVGANQARNRCRVVYSVGKAQEATGTI